MASRLPRPKNVWIGVSVADQRLLGRSHTPDSM